MAVDRALEPLVHAGSLKKARTRGPTADGSAFFAEFRSLAEFERRLGHQFRDQSLLGQALTHVGALDGRGASYQRLEFLGDRVLGLIVADMVFAEYPDAAEGELSRRLAHLVRKETCAAVATDWGCEAHIRLGAGERNSRTLRKAILADICESVIGAVFLDGGLEAARTLVRRSFEARMLSPDRPLRDAKTALQEWAQSKGLPAPTYREVSRSGPDHAPEFKVTVSILHQAAAEASGRSKRFAEQAAAAAFMKREGLEDAGEHDV